MKFAGKWKTLEPMKNEPSPLLTPPPVGIPDRNPGVKSLRSWDSFPALKREADRYTGKNIVGIAAMHKSNLVPVFSAEEARDTAKMRRN
jgi:hypothetical protein